MSYVWDADGNRINPATEETLENLVTTNSPPDVILSGEKTVALAATPEQLVATSTPCKFVWIGAPVTQATGAAVNTKLALIGDSNSQTIPLVQSNFEGFTIVISDASGIHINIGVNGESVRYAIFR